MKDYITRAINERRMLRLVYEARRRLTIEPHLLGRTPDGHDAVLCRQVAPPLADGTTWRLLRLDRISSLQTLDRVFESPPGERPPTDAFSSIEAHS